MGDTEQLGLHARARVSKFFSKGPDSKIFQALQAIECLLQLNSVLVL